MSNKTHYRKAFNSPYLSSADITEPTVLTIKRVSLEPDKTKKTKEFFNTAYFVEKELRPGEKLKPMILNVNNSKALKDLVGSHFIEDWQDVRVTVYVNPNVKFGRDTVEGLRISGQPPRETLPQLTPDNEQGWLNAIAAFQRDGNLNAVLSKRTMSKPHQELLIKQASQ